MSCTWVRAGGCSVCSTDVLNTSCAAVLELCNGGQLMDYDKKTGLYSTPQTARGVFDEEAARRVMHDVVPGLLYSKLGAR